MAIATVLFPSFLFGNENNLEEKEMTLMDRLMNHVGQKLLQL